METVRLAKTGVENFYSDIGWEESWKFEWINNWIVFLINKCKGNCISIFFVLADSIDAMRMCWKGHYN